MNNPKKILQQYWGFSSFKPTQEAIINSVISGKDTLVLLPTGGGKSVCYQIPALIKDGICIVISPLLALIEDQINSLSKKGIKAMRIPSGISQNEQIILFDNLQFNNYKFLYLSPERLQSKFIQEKIKQLQVNLIAIDEAHCISEWGHDFRPSYRNITVLRSLKPQANYIALTASATKIVIDDIINCLHLKEVQVFKKSFYRENLSYQVIKTEDKLLQLQRLCKLSKSPTIVYVNTRNKTKSISNYLNANGFKSSYYHGGLTNIEKKLAFNNWMVEKTPIIVATNAFGMGIDKPNVKQVIHLNLPSSIENYIQEAGRAGRNQQAAFSTILWNENDTLSFKSLIDNSFPSLAEIKQIHQKLYQYFFIAKGELTHQVFDFNFFAFCNTYNFIPNKTFNALQILHNNGVIELNQGFQKKSTLQFLVTSKQVTNLVKTNPTLYTFVNSILRLYTGIFEQPIKIDEFYMAKKTEIPSWHVIKNLETLASKELVAYKKSSKNASLIFLHPREDDRTINQISKNIEIYLRQKKQKTTDLINFIKNDRVCRSVQILHYFDEKNTENCGICDICVKNKQNFIKNISEKIIQLIHTKGELSSKEIHLLIHEKETDILINLQQLLANEKIGINLHNKYYIK
ncbi:ATP-dependent DNA helicase RecQ [Tenacibaculum sp. UWU-22]|uniref:RecQ family ATP-dependent DNA helicase n=1 Tax=Tenacibaculum sp. UWU-22 TaxID=3234187 RepID=UPI0034DB57E6